MSLLEGLDRQLEGLFELSVDDFLSTPLDQVLGVVLRHLLVRACGEANHRSRARMAHIDTDQHGSLAVHRRRELHLVEIPADLAVDLPQNIRSLGEVEGAGVATSHHLGGDLVHGADLLEHLVVRLPVDDAHGHLWVAELAVLALHHVVEEGSL